MNDVFSPFFLHFCSFYIYKGKQSDSSSDFRDPRKDDLRAGLSPACVVRSLARGPRAVNWRFHPGLYRLLWGWGVRSCLAVKQQTQPWKWSPAGRSQNGFSVCFHHRAPRRTDSSLAASPLLSSPLTRPFGSTFVLLGSTGKRRHPWSVPKLY